MISLSASKKADCLFAPRGFKGTPVNILSLACEYTFASVYVVRTWVSHRFDQACIF